MMTKIDHIKKLLSFLGGGADKFIAPRPLPSNLCKMIGDRMRDGSKLDDDVVDIWLCSAKPLAISIFTALESHHNGSLYDEHSEEVPVFDEFLDFAIGVLRNRAHNIVHAQIEAEENQRKQMRAEARMKELGL